MPGQTSPWELTSLTGLFDGGFLGVLGASPRRSGEAEQQPGGQQPSPREQQPQAERGTSCEKIRKQVARPAATGKAPSLPGRGSGSDLPALRRLGRASASGAAGGVSSSNTSVSTSPAGSHDDEPGVSAFTEHVAAADVVTARGRVPCVPMVEQVDKPTTDQQQQPPPQQQQQEPTSFSRPSDGSAVPASASGDGRPADRWARAGGTTSSASTLLPDVSPAATPAGDGHGLAFDSAPAPAPALRKNTTADTEDGGPGLGGGRSHLPTPLDLSVIRGPAPPPMKRSGGGRFASTSSCSTASSSTKPVVLRGEALENLQRLGRPRSSLSDRSKDLGSPPTSASTGFRSGRPGTGDAPSGGAAAAAAADATAVAAAIPMDVPLGAAMPPPPPLGSNTLLPRRTQKQLRSAEVTRSFQTTGSVVEEVGWAKAAALGGVRLGACGPALARSESDTSSRGMGFPAASAAIGVTEAGEISLADGGRGARHKAEQQGGSSSDDDHPPPPSPMLTAHLRGPQNPRNRRRSTAKQPQQQQRPAGRVRTFKGRGARPQTWTEDDELQESPGNGGGGKAALAQASHANGGANPSGGDDAPQGQQQRQEQAHTNQMRLVPRNPAEAGTTAGDGAAAVNYMVSPGALSMRSTSTAVSRDSRGGNGGGGEGSVSNGARGNATALNCAVSPGALSIGSLSTALSRDSRKGSGGGDGGPVSHGGNADGYERQGPAKHDGGAAAPMTLDLAPGLGRKAFEEISLSPAPFHGNDLVGVSKAIPSEVARPLPVGEVPPLDRRARVAVEAAPAAPPGYSSSHSGSTRNGSRRKRGGASGGGRRHVLASASSRSMSSVSDGAGRLDLPSLIGAHAPGRIYVPAAGASVSGSLLQHKRRGSGARAGARGTPAVHTRRGQDHHHPARSTGGGDASAPFRLPSNMRLTSFSSNESSVVSPKRRSDARRARKQQQKAGVRDQKAAAKGGDLGVDASELARRPTTIDMLSTFGSHGYSRGDNPSVPMSDFESEEDHEQHQQQARGGSQKAATNGGVPGPGTDDFARRPKSINSLSIFESQGHVEGDDSPISLSSIGMFPSSAIGDGGDTDHRRPSRTDSRRGRHGDRISQRRSRSGRSSHGGATRLFSSDSGVSAAAENDASGGRDRYRPRSASRSLSGGELEAAESYRSSSKEGERRNGAPRCRRHDGTNPPPDARHGFTDPAKGISTPAGVSRNHQHQQDERRSSLSLSGTVQRGRGRARDREASSPPRAKSLQIRRSAASADTAGGGSAPRDYKAMSPLSTTSMSRQRRSAGAGRRGGGGDPTGIDGSTKNQPRRASGVQSSNEGGDWGSSSHRRNHSNQGAGRHRPSGSGDTSSSVASSRRQRGPRGGVAALPATQEMDAVRNPAAKDVSLAGPEETTTAPPPPTAIGDDVPRMEGAPARPSAEAGSKRRLWSFAKPPIVPSTPRQAGVHRTPTIKKRNVRSFLGSASLFWMKNRGRSTSSSSSSDGHRDDGAAVATAVGVTGGNSTGGSTLNNAVRHSRSGGGCFTSWLWSLMTRQQPRRGGKDGGSGGGHSSSIGGSSRSSISSRSRSRGTSAATAGGGDALALLPGRKPTSQTADRNSGLTAAARLKTSSSGRGQQQQQHQQQRRQRQRQRPQHQSGRNALPLVSALRPKAVGGHNAAADNEERQRQPRAGAEGSGRLAISQFYDAPLTDGDNALVSGGGDGGMAHLKFPSPVEEGAEARARVQQLLRTSQVHMNTQSSRLSVSNSHAAAGPASGP